MSKEDLKTAEHRAYAKGYAAGKRRKQCEISRETLKRKKDALWVRAYLAVLPAAFSAQNWTRGEQKITALTDRVRLAAETADEAVKHAELHL